MVSKKRGGNSRAREVADYRSLIDSCRPDDQGRSVRKHILHARGHMKSRVRVTQRIVGATALWCVSCFTPDSPECEGETWAEFRMRAFRGARRPCTRLGWSAGAPCGCTGGLRFIGCGAAAPVVSCYFEEYRILSWWRTEQARPQSKRLQHKKHYPRLTLLEESLDAVAWAPWRRLAQDRRAWKEKEDTWVMHLQNLARALAASGATNS